MEAARGRVADAQVRMKGCKGREASLVEAGARAAKDLQGRHSRQKQLEATTSAVLPDLICPPGTTRLGVVTSALDRMFEALARDAGALWAKEVKNAGLLQCIACMPGAAQRLMDLQEAATTLGTH